MIDSGLLPISKGVLNMTDYCLFCQCEPIEPEGWIQRKDGEWVCPWCISDFVNGQHSNVKVVHQ